MNEEVSLAAHLTALPSRRRDRRPALQRADLFVAAAIFAAALAHLASLPRNLGHSDESIYLYESVRLLSGDRLYSDMFELITPGWMYLMAAVFWLFGPGIATARITAAALHGVSAALLYVVSRHLGVRRSLAVLPAAAFLVVAQPAWQIASQHWLGTLLCIALLDTCVVARRRPAHAALLPGLLVGALIGVQQARGVFMGAGVGAWLVADDLLCRRYRAAAPPLLASLAYLAAGAALVVLPLLLAMVASAGFEPVWRALVIQPLFNYGGQGRPPWGYVGSLSAAEASFTFPRLLTLLPVILVANAARLLWGWTRRDAPQVARHLALITIFCAASMISISYFPDFIHIAFISPIFFVAIAENAEQLARLLPPARRAVDRITWALAALLLVLTAQRLAENRTRLRNKFRFSRDTEFGRVAYAREREVALFDALHRRLAGVPQREIFTYPGFLNLYLTLGARNPTRFQFFFPGYSSPDQVESVIADLEKHKPPYVVVAAKSLLGAADPVWVYLQGAYAPVADAGDLGEMIYRRVATPP